MHKDNLPESQTPPAFPDSYHHARRLYGAVAGLLLAWEFVGINIQGSSSSSFPATLKNPEAAPSVLFVLVVYFAVRFTLEWFQSDPSRRSTAVSRFDFGLAHVIGVISVLLYSSQKLFKVQVANYLKPSVVVILLLGMVSGFASSEIYRYFKEGQTDKLRLTMFFFSAITPIVISVLGSLGKTDMMATVIGFLLGMVIGQILWYYKKMMLRKYALQKNR